MIDHEELAASLEATPVVLQALLEPIEPAALSVPPEPGEWSILQVVGHLLASEVAAFRDRVAAIVSGADEVPGFDPAAGVADRDFNRVPLETLLSELAAERKISAAYISKLTPEEMARTAPYGNQGTFAASDFIQEWAFHDQDHIQQILDVLKQRALPHFSESMRNALVDDGGAID